MSQLIPFQVAQSQIHVEQLQDINCRVSRNDPVFKSHQSASEQEGCFEFHEFIESGRNVFQDLRRLNNLVYQIFSEKNKKHNLGLNMERLKSQKPADFLKTP